MKKHKLKTAFYNFLEILPYRIGNKVYYSIKNFSKKNTYDELNSDVRKKYSTFLELKKILNQLDYSLKNKEVVELGTGWIPIMPYFFHFLDKAKKVLTYDLNEHISVEKAIEFNEYFEKEFSINIKPDNTKKIPIPNEISYFPNSNFITENIESNSVDIFFSRYVLPHVLEPALTDIIKKAYKILKKNGLMIHFLSMSDLRSHGNNSLSMWDFLKYSEAEWKNKSTRFDPHNRWRLPRYIELFESIFLNIGSTLKKGSKQYEMFTKLKLHNDFKKYSFEELTAGNIIVILKKI